MKITASEDGSLTGKVKPYRMPGGVHDMGMTAIEYAESLNRRYRRLAQRNTNSASLLDASAAPVKASCKARAEVYDLVAEELDGLIALMKEEHSNG